MYMILSNNIHVLEYIVNLKVKWTLAQTRKKEQSEAANSWSTGNQSTPDYQWHISLCLCESRGRDWDRLGYDP